MSEVLNKSFVEREEQFDDRWTSYGKHTGILKIYKRLPAEKLKEFDVFQDYDLAFLKRISPDVCVAVWDAQKVLFEEGSYIDLAFVVLQGHVNVYLQKQQDMLAQPIFDKHRTRIYSPDGRLVNGKREKNNSVHQSQIRQNKRKGRMTFLSSMDLDLRWGEVLNLGPGEILGETGASVGWPQSVTAQTASRCVLLQIRVPALEAMKRKSRALKDRLNQLYIERSLSAQLRSTPLFQGCSASFIEEFKKHAELRSFRRSGVIAREGALADSVYLVRSGFVKLSQKLGDGEVVVNYLSKGMLLGEVEYTLQQREWVHTATSVENTELVRFSYAVFQTLLDAYPKLQQQLFESSATRVKESGYSKRNIARSEFISTALETGLVEGNSVFVIDLDVCTRCDDCVKGCADTHGGMPRFVREGEKYGNYLITRACYHCQDPVCLIGCPTGAIRRAGVEEVVEIDADLCIGCRVCYNKCPYNAITMVAAEQQGGSYAAPQKSESKAPELATKCDLCYDVGHGPACVTNCPHACAIRVDRIETFARLLSRSERMRKVWRSTKLGRLLQSPGWFVAFVCATVLALSVYAINVFVSEVRAGNVWGLSYGAGATVLLTGAALYGVRRRMVKTAATRGLGRSFTWVQFHVYGGALFLLLVLMHTGFRLPNGTLYWWLWLLSAWVTASGLFGVFLQKWIASVLSSGMSLEVLSARIPQLSREIRDDAEALLAGCSQPVQDFYRKKVVGSLRRPQARLTYLFDITGGIQRKLKQFRFLKGLLGAEERERVNQLELLLKSKLEMDAHFTLQRILRWWMVLHLPPSIVLLVLVAIHLLAVFYY